MYLNEMTRDCRIGARHYYHQHEHLIVRKTLKVKKIHADEHEWGCDQCLLCFKTKYSANLHELEHHGDTPDSIS